MAAAAVVDFFERFSDGWLYDQSQLKKLWAAFRKGKDAAGAQLAKCLLVYISAPEKHESDKHVPKCLRDWASLMPTDEEGKPWAEEILGSLLEQLAEWIPQAAKHSRVRVLDLIIALLRGLHPETMLDEAVRLAIVEALREHLPDKDDKVRQMAVVALAKLGCREGNDLDGESDAADLVLELTEALHSDISQDVRTEVINRLPLSRGTFAEVLRHQGDRSARVAAMVYDRVARDVPLEQSDQQGAAAASPDVRRSLLWYGLHEPRGEVRSAAVGLLREWFTKCAGGDVVALLEALSPQTHPEVCLLVLEQLVDQELWDPRAWLQTETTDENRSAQQLWIVAENFDKQQQQQQQPNNGAAAGSAAASASASWLAGVNPALIFAWVFATQKVEEVALDRGRAAAEKVGAVMAQVEASAGAQAEAALDAFLPTAKDTTKLCLLAAEAGPSHRFIAAQLLDMTTLSYMTWTDASSREAAEATLWALVTRVSRPQGPELPARRPGNAFLPAADGGSGAWEAAVLRFAVAVYGHDGAALVAGVLPMVLQLAGGGPVEHAAEVAETLLLEALTYLHLLMAAAGPSVPPSASASVLQQPAAAGAAAGGSSDGSDGDGSGASWSLARAVDGLAWNASGHASPAVRAAAARCCVELCLRDGGLAHLPRAMALLAPMLPTGATGGVGGDDHTHGYDDDLEYAALQQLPRRVALQGLMDLALTWGEPTVTAELRRVVAAAAGRRGVDDVTAQLAALGVDADGRGGAEGRAGADPAAPAAGVAGEAQGVVPIMLRLTEGVVRRFQGSDGYVPARGMVADALLGSARLVHGWSFQLRLNKRLRHQVVTAMQPRLAEQLLTRLLLARFSPALESEPWVRSQLSAFFKSFQEAASAPGEEGAVHRRMLAGAFLHTARCAMALPAPAGAPATARGCAAPALMDFAAELLASSAAAAIASTPHAHEDAGDEVVSGKRGPGAADAADAADAAAAVPIAADAVVALCELVLEEVVRLASPGAASLDTAEGRVRAYGAELCKTPMRLLRGLPLAAAASSRATLDVIRVLAWRGRRAVVAAGESLVKTVVPDTAYKKLQEFVRELEELQQVKTSPLSDADAKTLLEAWRGQLEERLEELPSLEDVTADLVPDDEWDTLTADGDQPTASGAAGAAGAGRGKAAARKRGGAAAVKTGNRSGAGAAKGRGGTATRSGGNSGKRTATGTARSGSSARGAGRRSDTRNAADADSHSDSEGRDSSDGDFVSDDERRRPAGSAAARVTKGSGRRSGSGAGDRPASSQATTTATTTTTTTSDVGSQPSRRSSRSAAIKASARLEALRSERS